MATTAPEIGPETPVILMDVPECTLQEYARRTGRCYNTIKRLAQTGEIPTVKYGKEKQGAVMVNLMKVAERNLNKEW